jgi:hypothetical protein
VRLVDEEPVECVQRLVGRPRTEIEIEIEPERKAEEPGPADKPRMVNRLFGRLRGILVTAVEAGDAKAERKPDACQAVVISGLFQHRERLQRQRLAQQHLTGCRRVLQPRRHIDRISGRQPLSGSGHHFPAVDPDPCPPS